MSARDAARAAGALALAAVTILVLRLAHADWTPALFAGAGAALFTAWRTVPGACAGFAAFCAAATFAWIAGDPFSLGGFPAVLPWALALEAFGLLTVLAVALVRDPRRVSRRLLGSFLASTGLGLLGVALCASGASRAIGSALVAGALAYRLGAVPVFAWVPMLLRHPSPGIEALGVAGVIGAGAVLARALPLVPDPASAAAALAALSAATIPWAGWHAWRQRTSDPACARTYVIVIGVSVVLFVAALRLSA